MSDTQIKQLMHKLTPYVNKWVAFNENREEIVTFGKSIKEVEKKLQLLNKKASFIQFILPFDSHYAPYVNQKNN